MCAGFSLSEFEYCVQDKTNFHIPITKSNFIFRLFDKNK